jgi:hypothetical protein
MCFWSLLIAKGVFK